MNIQHIDGSLMKEERETVINCYYDNNDNLVWEAESSIPAHITRLKRAGWEQTGALVSSTNGAEQSVTFRTAHESPVSFRDLTKPKRTMSEEEKQRKRELLKAHNPRQRKQD